MNEEIDQFHKKGMIIELVVGDLDGRSGIRADEFPFRGDHVLSQGGDFKRLENCDILLFPEYDSSILRSDEKCNDVYML